MPASVLYSAAGILPGYLSLFSPVHRQKLRFMALASAVLSQAADLLALYRSALPSALSPETAEGFHLDTLSLLAGVPRPSPDTSDADYRAYIRAKTALHHWDGTNGSLPALLAEAFPGMDARLADNMDGTVTASFSASSVSFPFPLKDVFPYPAGIRLTENQQGANLTPVKNALPGIPRRQRRLFFSCPARGARFRRIFLKGNAKGRRIKPDRRLSPAAVSPPRAVS